MRTAFIQELTVLARSHPKIFLMVGDLGFSVVEPFAKEFPNRYLNAGIAEQNMAGMAAGMASEGWHVFIYSIANFPTLRCLEQLRNDACYHNLPVTVVAVGAGLAYGNLGYSHHAVQDIGCMRGLPNIHVYSPADPGETRLCLRRIVGAPGPSYLRVGKAGEKVLHEKPDFNGGLIHVAGPENSEVAVVATGSVLEEALTALNREEATPFAVYSLVGVTPLAPDTLAPLWNHRHLITIEEHLRPGGIGELLAGRRPAAITMDFLHIKEELNSLVGSQTFLRRRHGIDAEAVSELVRRTRRGT